MSLLSMKGGSSLSATPVSASSFFFCKIVIRYSMFSLDSFEIVKYTYKALFHFFILVLNKCKDSASSIVVSCFVLP